MPETRRLFLAQLAAQLAALGCRARSFPARDRASSKPPAPPPPPPPPTWEPARTWVFVASSLRWLRPELYPSFDDDVDGRRDEALVAAFAARGVPASQTAKLLDAQATRAAMASSLAALLAQTRPGDTLWYFFSGHGVVEDEQAYFVPYDAGDELSESGVSMASVVDAIARRFKGSRVILASDCCRSGSLVPVASRLDGVCAWAAYGSSLASESSADSWTFTNCLIDAIRGAPSADVDGDGAITLAELGSYAEIEMAFVDGQLSTCGRGAGMPGDLVLARASAPHDPRGDARFEARWQDAWYAVDVLERGPQGARVRYRSDEAPDDELVPASRLRPWHPNDLPVGTRVEVEREGDWHGAVVLEARLGIHHVHYRHASRDEDEWVAPARVRLRGGAARLDRKGTPRPSGAHVRPRRGPRGPA